MNSFIIICIVLFFILLINKENFTNCFLRPAPLRNTRNMIYEIRGDPFNPNFY